MGAEHLRAVLLERGLHQGRHVLVLPCQQPRSPFHQAHLCAQSRKGLAQLTTHGAATEHHDAPWQAAALRQLRPQCLASGKANVLKSGHIWHHRLGACCDHDATGPNALHRLLRACHLYGPGVDNCRVALEYVHAQGGVALDAVVRRDVGDHLGDARHQRRKVKLRGARLQPKLRGGAHLVRYFGALDKGLARHAAGVQTVAAQGAGFHQGDFGLRRRRDIGRHQSTGARTNHHHVGVKAPRPLRAPGREHPAVAQALEQLRAQRWHQGHQQT